MSAFALKLEDFLPGYPTYDDALKDDMFQIYPYDSEDANYLKQEFLENKLDASEDKPASAGMLLNHQKFISRFLSPKTLNDEILLFHAPGTGKCHSKDTPIIMFDGSIKMVQDIQKGDVLMGDDSNPRKVLSLAQGVDEMYDIIPVKGEKYTVNSEHILCLKYSGNETIYEVKSQKKKPFKVKYVDHETYKLKAYSFSTNEDAQEYLDNLGEQVIEIEVKNYLKLPLFMKSKLKGYRKGIEFPYQDVMFDPYIIGFWLGDGSKRSSVITSQDSSVLKYIRYKIIEYGLNLNYQSQYDYRLSAEFRGGINQMIKALTNYGLINNKHIPLEYTANSREVRLQLLAGLIDSDGDYSIKDKCFTITQKLERLADDIVYLCRTLGFAAYKKSRTGTWTYKGIKNTGTYFRVSISGNGMSEIPTKIPRKRATDRTQIKDAMVTGINVNSIGKGDYYGFTLDGNNRYLLGDCTVTHNTCSSVAIAELARQLDPTLRKTLVLVKGATIEKNFKNQLVRQCTSGQYIPDDFDNLTSGEQVTRTAKKIKVHYEFKTFQTFAAKLALMTDYHVAESYSNRVIIIDEAHNIRIATNTSVKIQVYKQIHRMLHLVRNRKIILMTATPMRDLPEEFAAIMNLILPLSHQLPTLGKFKEYYIKGTTLVNVDELQKYIRGRVSYLRSAHSNLLQIFEGEVLTAAPYNMSKLKIKATKMSDLQSKGYEEALALDKKKHNIKDKDTMEAVVEAEVEEEIENGAEGSENSGIYNNSRQATLFVFPDGSYGGKANIENSKLEGVAKYVKRPKNNEFTLTTEMRDLLIKVNGKEATPAQRIENIRKYSSKYADTIEQIIAPANEKENVFIFTDLIDGSGAYLFGLLLELFNFRRAKGYKSADGVILAPKEIKEQEEVIPPKKAKKGKKGVGDEKKDEYDASIAAMMAEFEAAEQKEKEEMKVIKRKTTRIEQPTGAKYAIITGDNPITNTERLLAMFNSKENSEGKILRVIIGSRVIGEGTNLLNVRQIHILTPFWNNSMTEQAIGRGIRAFSHDDLPKDQRYVKIYRHAALPSNSTVESIDVTQYKRSEDKDFLMKQIERQCKISAVDCSLNFDRNLRNDDIDGTRDCDYLECKYKCEDLDVKAIEQDLLITDTYDLFYADQEAAAITTVIKQMFRKKFHYDLTELLETLPNSSSMIIVRALKNIIDSSVQIINRYGLPSYLREDKNLYFLVDQITLPNRFTLGHYAEYPNVRQELTFHDIIRSIQYQTIPTRMDIFETFDLKNKNDKEAFIRQLKILTLDLQESFLEAAYSAKKQYTELLDEHKNKLELTEEEEKQKLMGETVIEEYIRYIIILDDGTVVSTLLDDYRWLPPGKKNYEWETCPPSVEEDIKLQDEAKEIGFKKNPYGYYGILTLEDVFQLVIVNRNNVKKKKDGSGIDNRTITTGIVAKGLNKNILMKVLIDLKIEPPGGYKSIILKNIKDEINNLKLSFKDLPTEVFDSLPNNIPSNKLKLISGWSKTTKEEMAHAIHVWMKEHDLLKLERE